MKKDCHSGFVQNQSRFVQNPFPALSGDPGENGKSYNPDPRSGRGRRVVDFGSRES